MNINEDVVVQNVIDLTEDLHRLFEESECTELEAIASLQIVITRLLIHKEQLAPSKHRRVEEVTLYLKRLYNEHFNLEEKGKK